MTNKSIKEVQHSLAKKSFSRPDQLVKERKCKKMGTRATEHFFLWSFGTTAGPGKKKNLANTLENVYVLGTLAQLFL